ncbi:hypothetical protein AX17_001698 [Amanita inopinata Kibby_2008]|nr:hypothetical protein AX17_001698 [Amanita inopinata Kibby_2008]
METNQQPTARPPMSSNPEGHDSMVKGLGKQFSEGAAKEAGKEAVQHATDPGVTDQVNHQMDDAKAQAQGLWAKYCGCFSSAI